MRQAEGDRGRGAYKILTAVYYIISRRQPYRELGAGYFDAHKRAHAARTLARRLRKLGDELGFAVTIDIDTTVHQPLPEPVFSS